MAERIRILLYGPRALRYASHELVVPHLGVEVTEPPRLVPLPPAAPTRPLPPVPEPVTRPPGNRPKRRKTTEINYFRGAELRDEPEVFDIESGVYFQPIEHEGLIVVIEAATFLPRETFERTFKRAERWDVSVIPIYVRRIGNIR